MARNSNGNRGLLRRKSAVGQSGQSLIELALVAPLLIAMVLGAIEIGRYAYLSILVADAAHAGALYGAQSNANAADTTGITAAADKDYYQNNNGQNVSALTVSSWQACGCDSGGTYTQLASTKVLASACTTTYIDPTTACGTTASDQTQWTVTVYVQATATFTSLFNYPWIPSSIKVSRTAIMRVQQ